MKPFISDFQGKYPQIHPNARIAANAVIIGDVEIGADSSIWYGCVIRGDVNRIEIGQKVNIQDGSVVHGQSFGAKTIIGDFVSIGHLALIHACILQDYSFVGMKACVMNNALIESKCLIAAGSLVGNNKTCGANRVFIGNPARELRPCSESDYKLMEFTFTNYVELAAKQLPSAADWGISCVN